MIPPRADLHLSVLRPSVPRIQSLLPKSSQRLIFDSVPFQRREGTYCVISDADIMFSYQPAKRTIVACMRSSLGLPA